MRQFSWYPDVAAAFVVVILAGHPVSPLVNRDGGGLERVTFRATFDGFPMFAPDGKPVVFASSRQAGTTGEIDAFVADWVE